MCMTKRQNCTLIIDEAMIMSKKKLCHLHIQSLIDIKVTYKKDHCGATDNEDK